MEKKVFKVTVSVGVSKAGKKYLFIKNDGKMGFYNPINAKTNKRYDLDVELANYNKDSIDITYTSYKGEGNQTALFGATFLLGDEYEWYKSN